MEFVPTKDGCVQVGHLHFSLERLHVIPDRSGYLLGELVINGVSFHIEAYEVEVKDSVQIGATEAAREHLSDMPYMDGPFDTVEYDGKQYVLHIFPHC